MPIKNLHTPKYYEVSGIITTHYNVPWTGHPSGEPCKHQHTVANKLNVTAPNLLPYFNVDGRYLHASITIGPLRVGDKNFYAGSYERNSITKHTSFNIQSHNPTDSVEMADNTTQVAGTRRMHVQPTAISRRRVVGSKMAPSSRPPKRPCTHWLWH